MRPCSCVYLASSEKPSDLTLMRPPLLVIRVGRRPHGIRERPSKQQARAAPDAFEQRLKVRPEALDDDPIAPTA